MLDMPYFMENEKWYYFDFKKRKYVLTEEAPKEAIQSYNEYYEEIRKMRNYGNRNNS